MRTNIELRAWNDERILNLAFKLKVRRYVALGAMAEIWNYCQDHQTATISKVNIDRIVGIKRFVDVAIECDLLTLDPDQEKSLKKQDSVTLYVRGMKRRLEEIQEYHKKMSDLGKKGADKKYSNSKRALSARQAHAKRTLSAPIASYSLMSSVLKEEENTNINSLTVCGGIHAHAHKAPPHTPENNFEGISDKVKTLVKLWKEDFERIYGVPPLHPPKQHLKAAREIVERVGDLERLKKILYVFFRCKNQYYIERGHDFVVLLDDLNKMQGLVVRHEAGHISL